MKRDLKKWIRSNYVRDFLKDRYNPEHSDKLICEDLLRVSNYSETDNIAPDELVQFIWCAGQKQFLKDILDDIDDMIEKLFNGKDSVKNDKARRVAEEAQLRAWLYNKYKYLQRKNGN